MDRTRLSDFRPFDWNEKSPAPPKALDGSLASSDGPDPRPVERTEGGRPERQPIDIEDSPRPVALFRPLDPLASGVLRRRSQSGS